MKLKISGIIKESIVDGNGIRLVVFTQGCPHDCPGCHNPQSHDPSGGYGCEIDTILQETDKNPLLSGLTFSGGEPFLQPEPLLALAKEVRKRKLGLIIYTGYLFEELKVMNNPDVDELISLADHIIDGPFLLEEKDLGLRFRGSKNQRIIDVKATLASGAIVTCEL